MRSRHKVIVICFGLLCVALVLVLSRRERPLLDLIDDYKVLHSLRDQDTGRIIELGVLFNFGSTEYELGVYDELRDTRPVYGLRKQNISIVGYPGPVPELVQFDGKCYFLALKRWRKDWDRINPVWRDEANGKEICFYVLVGNRVIDR